MKISNSYENINEDRNNYLNKKRIKEYIQTENKCNYNYGNIENNNSRYNKYKKYNSNPYNENYYYNMHKRRNYYYNKSQNFMNNKYVWKKDYNKFYKKPFEPVEGTINNTYDHNTPSSRYIDLKEKDEENSLCSFSSSTNFNSPYKSNNGLNNNYYYSNII